jgi:hypothetical protein
MILMSSIDDDDEQLGWGLLVLYPLNLVTVSWPCSVDTLISGLCVLRCSTLCSSSYAHVCIRTFSHWRIVFTDALMFFQFMLSVWRRDFFVLLADLPSFILSDDHAVVVFEITFAYFFFEVTQCIHPVSLPPRDRSSVVRSSVLHPLPMPPHFTDFCLLVLHILSTC